VNDTDQALEELALYAGSLGAHVNLIHSIDPGIWCGVLEHRVREFRDGLEAMGINVTVRTLAGALLTRRAGN